MKQSHKRLLQIIIILAITVAGYVTLRASFADTIGAVVEPESASVLGNAAVINDASASSGKSITFGSSSYGPLPAGPPASSYVTPEQFGAVGNGTADDTNAVQAALNAGAGKTIWLAANKTYLIASKSLLVPGDNTTVTGAGANSVLKFTWADNSQASSGKGNYFRNRNITPGAGDANITWSNFVIEGAGDGKPSGLSTMNPEGLTAGLRPTGMKSFTITRMEVRNIPGLSVSYHDSQNGSMTNNYVHNSGRDGMTGFWSPGAGGANTNITVANNYVARVGDDAIGINGLPEPTFNNISIPSNIRIINNTIEGWPSDPNGKMLGRGMIVFGAKNVLIQNNSIVNTSVNSPAIMVVGCTPTICARGSYDPATNQPWLSDNVRVLDNTLYNVGRLGGISPGNIGSGIYINTSRNHVVTNNRIVNSAHPAIRNESCVNCTVQAQ